MRILTLSQWYLPEPEIKIHLLGRDLAARGHSVTAITGFPNYPQGRVYPGFRQRLWQREEMNGVRVVRLPLFPDRGRSAWKRAANYLSFAASAAVLGPALSGPADVAWVYHPPLTVAIPALSLSWLRRVPFVYEVQDMWPETLPATGMVSNPRLLSAVRRFADLAYRHAAAITVISPGFRENLIEKGVPAEKIHVIPNWADEEVYRPLPRDPALAAAHGLEGRFNVIFAGNMGPAQALSTAVEAASQLRDLPAVQFVFIGDGLDVPELQRMVEARGLDNVRFLGRQPAERMPEFLALGDALLVHLRRDPLFEITIPSKTLSYLACARPVICGVAGDAAEVVRDAGAGIVCPPEDPAALADSVRRLYAMAPEERERMGRDARAAFLGRYTRRVLVDRYEALLREVADRRRRPAEHTSTSGRTLTCEQ